jgi:FMN phosphatase YigB (HAD superfamily)
MQFSAKQKKFVRGVWRAATHRSSLQACRLLGTASARLGHPSPSNFPDLPMSSSFLPSRISFRPYDRNDSLVYTLNLLGLRYETGVFEQIMDKYVHLELYPDAKQALVAMKGRKLAILSNGSSDMLNTLVRNTGMD